MQFKQNDIVQDFSKAQTLDKGLKFLVNSIRDKIKSSACSIFLVDERLSQYVLYEVLPYNIIECGKLI